MRIKIFICFSILLQAQQGRSLKCYSNGQFFYAKGSKTMIIECPSGHKGCLRIEYLYDDGSGTTLQMDCTPNLDQVRCKGKDSDPVAAVNMEFRTMSYCFVCGYDNCNSGYGGSRASIKRPFFVEMATIAVIAKYLP